MIKFDVITDELQEMFKDTLTVKDYDDVASNMGYSRSTVNVIIAKKVRINERTKSLVLALIARSEHNIEEWRKKYDGHMLMSREARDMYSV